MTFVPTTSSVSRALPTDTLTSAIRRAREECGVQQAAVSRSSAHPASGVDLPPSLPHFRLLIMLTLPEIQLYVRTIVLSKNCVLKDITALRELPTPLSANLRLESFAQKAPWLLPLTLQIGINVPLESTLEFLAVSLACQVSSVQEEPTLNTQLTRKPDRKSVV